MLITQRSWSSIGRVGASAPVESFNRNWFIWGQKSQNGYYDRKLTDSGLIKTLLTINKSIATVVNRGTPLPYLYDTYANVLTDKLRTVPSPYWPRVSSSTRLFVDKQPSYYCYNNNIIVFAACVGGPCWFSLIRVHCCALIWRLYSLYFIYRCSRAFIYLVRPVIKNSLRAWCGSNCTVQQNWEAF